MLCEVRQIWEPVKTIPSWISFNKRAAALRRDISISECGYNGTKSDAAVWQSGQAGRG